MDSGTTLNDQKPPGYPCQLDRLVSPFVPFYDRDGITIYNADCRQVLPFLDRFDLLLTDPPYGIEFRGKRIGSDPVCELTYDAYDDTANNYRQIIVPILWQCVERFRTAAIFTPSVGLSYLPPPRDVGGVFSDSCRGLSAFGFSCFHPVALYGKDVRRSGRVGGSWPCGFTHRGKVTVCQSHPCAKPLEWMQWYIDRLATDNDVVVDPFMGSGTTLLAAKLQGLRAVGIEISHEYCEVAVERLRQGVFGFDSEG